MMWVQRGVNSIVEQPWKIHLGPNVYLDLRQEAVVRDGMVRNLSRLQFRLLHFLAQHLNTPVSTESLIEYVWGQTWVSRDELYVYISRIKRILEIDPTRPDHLLTVRGYGYLLRTEPPNYIPNMNRDG
ncbi:Transcriptional regulatory protein, C terminal [Alicyclobacillus tolerans]|uniref:Transcriptional regulatory protein, C terminal n=2 Tax=Alicyclobacillus tolerans TaxID=90970 RepID=A0A1M6QXK9_9BACL|nr:Transcriptional regulatory protein, C terminal [Alicyclobacillus montanus]